MTKKTILCVCLLNLGVALCVFASNMKNGWGILLSFIGGLTLVAYTIIMRTK